MEPKSKKKSVMYAKARAPLLLPLIPYSCPVSGLPQFNRQGNFASPGWICRNLVATQFQ